MTFDEAMEAMITAGMARREIEKHGLAWADFVAEYGERQHYRGRDVLVWLGY